MLFDLPKWLLTDSAIVLLYGFQHSFLTSRIAVRAFNAIFPNFLWNIIYSIISVLILFFGFYFWESSGIYLFHLIPGSIPYHLSVIALSMSLFFFFFCFKYTTSFWQWLGVRQVAAKLLSKPMPDYYRVRKEGIKRYIRFPHHTCLIFLFWTHPVMTVDTLFLAIAATIYLYIGTYHQDLRGLRLLGNDWAVYRQNTNLLLPGPNVLARMWNDWMANTAPSSAGAVEVDVVRED